MNIEPKPVAAYPWWLRLIFRRQARKYGAPFPAAMLWGRTPRLFAGFSRMYRAVDSAKSPLEPALRSLLMVRISQINHCPFCVDLNASILLERGADDAKAAALDEWQTSDLFDEPERTALDYAEAMTLSDRDVDDELMARVKTHFDDDAVIELTALIAFQNMSSKFNAALDVPAQGYCRVPLTERPVPV